MKTALIAFILLAFFIVCIKGCQENEDCNQNFDFDLTENYKRKFLHEIGLDPNALPQAFPNVTSEELHILIDESKKLGEGKQTFSINLFGIVSNLSHDSYIFPIETIESISGGSIKVTVEITYTGQPKEEGSFSGFPVALSLFKIFKNGTIEAGPFFTVPYYLTRHELNDKLLNESHQMEISLNNNVFINWEKENLDGFKIKAEFSSKFAKKGWNINISSLPFRPLLNIKIDEKGRSKRHMGDYCPEGSGIRTCCLRDFIVDFRKFGWPFLVYPTIYNAKMCRGICGYRADQYHNSPHGAIMDGYGSWQTGAHCCHPNRYDSIKAVYSPDGMSIASKVIQGMVVESCACA